MKIVIAGAGIGGLTAAMCLHRAGHDVHVFEAVSEMRPLGVGINIQAGAVRILCNLGLEPALAATAIETRELRYANRHGQTIWADPRGRHAGLPWPQFSIHRGELQMILLDAAKAMLGADRIRLGRRIARFAQHHGKVSAHFVDRDGMPVENAEADLLIGADGIHSAVRAHFYPDEGPPKWQGILMWRGVTVGKPYLGGNTMVQAGHHNQKFVCYPISRAHAERGEALINWICDLHMGDGALPSREDWNKPGRLEDFLPRFADWNFGWLDVPEVIRTAHTILEFPMIDRDPLPRWSHGRITLLGDAAHPMYPIGSNGASQAILDGEAITQELAVGDDPEKALRRYEERRLPPTARIVESNRRKGIDVMLDIVEQRAPQGFTDLESVLPADELEKIVGDYKKLVTQDRETLLKLAAAPP
ncbi:flavin-dependent oxidoreductase [Reyranella sp. MMS21-HV4-11]|jgi:2-polyprenyl-6-methoxyphenol hydroxylase-like FAD-dependent oxidoreductase|uniref:Flavin-dependent oxidoreductase n=1 Tax=Reyranella humidisoli TaxID=2849149 RepID=A0ABS6IEF3_9HYPH|nr:flavin-dependent oxidoreductase [Reyranella sp. MMS21-HV4-11]MBU8872986.1 flavin-dependent oxidoreductase [Reyranella sp. MMS21-HV4-11]